MSIYCSTEFDERFAHIDHYRIFPEMLPWVGVNYALSFKKLLVVGESHYLPTGRTVHHDSEGWYRRSNELQLDELRGIKTRGTIGNGIGINPSKSWKIKSKTIYRNVERALLNSTMFNVAPQTAFTEVAFMNYFQRPGHTSGDSIHVNQLDKEVSVVVFSEVVRIIQP